jgi:hypothetical protein
MQERLEASEVIVKEEGFEPYQKGVVCNVSDLRRSGYACPRCKAIMDQVVWIAPVGDEPGLIGYECPVCRYVTSVLWRPGDAEQGGHA